MIWTSILGIIALVGLARVLGFAKNPALDTDTARSVVEAALPGFVATAAAVDPRTRTVTVYQRPDQPTVLDVGDILDGADVLRGFHLAVRVVFAELDRRG